METAGQVRKRYEDALADLVERARADPYVLAVILLGSLSYDVVWDRSDIDLCVVIQEGKHRKTGFTLNERGVNIHAFIVTRGEFKRLVEGSAQSSFMHSLMSKGQIVYSRDETLDELYEAREKFGDRDRSIRLLSAVCTLLWSHVKAHKWLEVKHDPEYCFFWIMKSLDSLAGVEAAWHGEIASREVIHQALRLKPAVFEPLYTGLINGPKTEPAIAEALQTIDHYLMERAPVLFEPLYEYLAEAGGPRSASEIDDYFGGNFGLSGVSSVCEWLADQGLVDKLAAPVRVTERSRVDFQEAAYYYDRDAVH